MVLQDASHQTIDRPSLTIDDPSPGPSTGPSVPVPASQTATPAGVRTAMPPGTPSNGEVPLPGSQPVSVNCTLPSTETRRTVTGPSSGAMPAPSDETVQTWPGSAAGT